MAHGHPRVAAEAGTVRRRSQTAYASHADIRSLSSLPRLPMGKWLQRAPPSERVMANGLVFSPLTRPWVGRRRSEM